MDAEHIDWREPPPEAYSRVTNPERFRPLHGHALELLARLRATYDLAASEAFELLPGLMHPFEHARPPVTLTPRVPGAAPIAVAFTMFPSLLVRCGWWHSAAFPSCGCDACGEEAADQAERLDQLAGLVVAGLFAEELRIPLFGDARRYVRFGDGTPREGPSGEGWTTLPRALARGLAGSGPRRVAWRAWPRRAGHHDDHAPAV
jgi:hypothetical protein